MHLGDTDRELDIDNIFNYFKAFLSPKAVYKANLVSTISTPTIYLLGRRDLLAVTDLALAKRWRGAYKT